MTKRNQKIIFLHFLLFLVTFSANGQRYTRSEISFPDISGYQTLACDFHMHTVFSDGLVWPDFRVSEAWSEGLHAIAITEHIEYLPHSLDISADHNRAYQIAEKAGKRVGITVIHGSEITRDMPPGHLNAIFLNDSNPLDTAQYRDAVSAAAKQGAFIFWNHPCWDAQQPDTVRWWDDHSEMLDKNQLHGIEVVNSHYYCPEAHHWAIEKNLTMLGNSDIHKPVQFEYDTKNSHRTLTLVFAKDNSKEAIQEALFAGRTAIYLKNQLIGHEKYLQPLFEQSTEIKNPEVNVKKGQGVFLQIKNNADIDFELKRYKEVSGVSFPEEVKLKSGKTTALWIKFYADKSFQKAIHLPYEVKNLVVEPEKGLSIDLKIKVNYRVE